MGSSLCREGKGSSAGFFDMRTSACPSRVSSRCPNSPLGCCVAAIFMTAHMTRRPHVQFCGNSATSASLPAPLRIFSPPRLQQTSPQVPSTTCRDDHGGHCGDAYHRITPRVRFSRRATSRGRHDSARISFFSSRFHHLASPQPVPKSPAGQY